MPLCIRVLFPPISVTFLLSWPLACNASKIHISTSSLLILFFFLVFFFNWRIIVFQNFVVFCHALVHCPSCVAAMRTSLGYPCGRRQVEQTWIASAAWPKLASVSWQKWVRLAKRGRTTPVTTGTCEPYLFIVVCHWGSESCVLHGIIVAIGNWHTHLEIKSGMHPWKNC